ncbi:MAG: hypothetical protein Q9168_004678 [Polycauliona sp. 1 TL-2023]
MAAPIISVNVSLSQTTYYLTDPTPPETPLNVTSESSKALTFFTWSTVLNPRRSLRTHRFVITDLTTGIEVPQTPLACGKRGPFRRVRGCDDEKCLLTIEPGCATIVDFPFGLHGVRPLPLGSERDGAVVGTAMGVDGLEPGRRYRLDPQQITSRVWWRWGTKDDVLVDEGDVENRPYAVLFEAAEVADEVRAG